MDALHFTNTRGSADSNSRLAPAPATQGDVPFNFGDFNLTHDGDRWGPSAEAGDRPGAAPSFLATQGRMTSSAWQEKARYDLPDSEPGASAAPIEGQGMLDLGRGAAVAALKGRGESGSLKEAYGLDAAKRISHSGSNLQSADGQLEPAAPAAMSDPVATAPPRESALGTSRIVSSDGGEADHAVAKKDEATRVAVIGLPWSKAQHGDMQLKLQPTASAAPPDEKAAANFSAGSARRDEWKLGMGKAVTAAGVDSDGRSPHGGSAIGKPVPFPAPESATPNAQVGSRGSETSRPKAMSSAQGITETSTRASGPTVHETGFARPSDANAAFPAGDGDHEVMGKLDPGANQSRDANPSATLRHSAIETDSPPIPGDARGRGARGTSDAAVDASLPSLDAPDEGGTRTRPEAEGKLPRSQHHTGLPQNLYTSGKSGSLNSANRGTAIAFTGDGPDILPGPSGGPAGPGRSPLRQGETRVEAHEMDLPDMSRVHDASRIAAREYAFSPAHSHMSEGGPAGASAAPFKSGEAVDGPVPTIPEIGGQQPLSTPTAQTVTAPSALPSSAQGLAQASVQQIVGSLPNPLREIGSGTVEITLDPPELGRVRLSLLETGGSMTLSIVAERPETADLMRRNVDLLNQEFARSGLDAPNVRVDAGSGGNDGSAGRREEIPEDHVERGPDALDTEPLNEPTGARDPARALDLRL